MQIYVLTHATTYSRDPWNNMGIKRRNSVRKNRFSMLFPVLTIIGIGIVSVLSSGYEKSWSYNWNGIQESIKDSVLKARNLSYTGGLGPNNRTIYDKLSKSRLWIMNNTTDSELLKLTAYPNGTVKAIAYEGLIRSQTFDKKTDLILQSISDNEYKVYYSAGCEGIAMDISEYLLWGVLDLNTGLPPLPPELTMDYGLSDSDKEKIETAFNNRRK